MLAKGGQGPILLSEVVNEDVAKQTEHDCKEEYNPNCDASQLILFHALIFLLIRSQCHLLKSDPYESIALLSVIDVQRNQQEAENAYYNLY